MADPALTGLAGALGGATISQVLAGLFASRRDRRADLLGQLQQLRASLDDQQQASAGERLEIREALADVRERVAGIEGVIRGVLPPTPFEKPRRRLRGE